MSRIIRFIVLGYAVVQLGPALWEAGFTACLVGGVVMLVVVNPS